MRRAHRSRAQNRGAADEKRLSNLGNGRAAELEAEVAAEGFVLMRALPAQVDGGIQSPRENHRSIREVRGVRSRSRIKSATGTRFLTVWLCTS